MKALRLQVTNVQPIAARAEVELAIAMTKRGERISVEHWHSLSPAEQGRVGIHQADFNVGLKRDAEKRMKHMDGLPAEVRAVAHELGFPVVHAFYLAGIRKPNTIRHLILLARGLQTNGTPAAFGNHRTGSR